MPVLNILVSPCRANWIAPAGGVLWHLKEAPQVILHVASGGHQAEDQQQARRIHLKETQQKNKHNSKNRVTDPQISSLKCFGKRHDLWIGLQIYAQNISNMTWWFKRCLTSMKHTNTYPAYF